ncbi:TRAF family member-associated NF-kappa-B activator isoform X2 [Rhinatrema bivittatum]|uniref:TRAF family member-associated NF-kappa-B activator isoform X2 n=1 Tax=Rhinatrema bivittatum TaxID=194408 RepID=UPI00112DEF64|nr:TRAF family member-associated NF-kappa-B activator isoform X2 [Rhinatrema bivittatum]
MDKTSGLGEQLNKAYEVYRQACMERDQARKELKQKTENYEQQIREQQKKIVYQNSLITHLKSQLRTPVNSGNAHGMVRVSKLEDSETRGHEIPLNLTYEQLQEQLKSLLQREKHFKEQLENERFKLKCMEEENNLTEKKLESFINSKDEEIRILRTRLHEKLEMKEEHKIRGERDPAVCCISTSQESEREDLEKIVQEVKDEFLHICTLTRAQKTHLNRFSPKKEITNAIQFSTPIQCTDKEDEQTERLFKLQVKKDVCVTSITPRGLGQDEEDNCSVESLSKFSVKFPPTDTNSVFLQSAPENPAVSSPAGIENMLQEKGETKAGDLVTFKRPSSGSSPEPNSTTAVVQNLTHTDKIKPSNHIKTLMQSTQNKDPLLATGDHGTKCMLALPIPGASNENNLSLETSGRPVRGPQQPLWKPYHNQDDDLPTQACQAPDQNQPGVCEFCQAVFPPSTSKREFLRHLNTHFNEKL